MMSLCLVVVLLVGCHRTVESSKGYGYIPSFRIIGDVKDVLVIKGMEDFTATEVEVLGEKRIFLTLQELLDYAKPIPKEYELMLVGQDGLMAKIDGKGIEECYIGFSEENAWEFINPKHPISSNIKKIKEIVVISQEEDWDYGLNIINSSENIMNVTAGKLYGIPSRVFSHFQGTSSIEHQEGIYQTTIYTEEKIVPIKDLLVLSQEDKLLAMGAMGAYEWIDEDSYLKTVDNQINLIQKDGKSKIDDVRGIILNPPTVSIMDTYYDTSHYLEKDEKVLILFLDGFGYHQYLYAIENGYAPFLKTIERVEKATTIYQSVTPAGFAAMITGKPPYENGIYSRNQRELRVPTIFSVGKNLDKKTALIQGPIGVINTEIQPILNLDRNDNGTTDDEIFDTAIEKINGDYDLIMVHFKDIDKRGHSYGDLHEKTVGAITITDKYVGELVKVWKGKVIITADHGMHSSNGEGNHGFVRYEDIIVPYIVLEGGGKQ